MEPISQRTVISGHPERGLISGFGASMAGSAHAAQAMVWVVPGLSLCKCLGQKPCPFLTRPLKWLFQGEHSAWAWARTQTHYPEL